METYEQLKKRHSDEFGAFEGLFFAFNNSQLSDGMRELGLPEDDYKSIVSIGSGGYLRKDRRDSFKELFARHEQELKQLRRDEKRLIAAIVYELGNHEFCITGDPTDALAALGLTRETVSARILKKAINQCRIYDAFIGQA